jgi:DNA-binding beta-propeller fold protein YncE
MKRITTSIAAALMIVALSAASASAKVTKRVYTVGQDFVIAGTTVKAGTYAFSFDSEKGDLTITDRKTNEVVARAAARAEGQEKGAPAYGLKLTNDATPVSFASLSFDGKQVIRLSDTAAVGQK